LSRVVLILIVLAAALAVFCSFVPQAHKSHVLTREIAELDARIREQERLLEKNTRTRFLLENNPEYIETIARDKIDVMKSGEIIFRLKDRVPAPVTTAPSTAW
jgi:cell division protein FtsB